MTTSFVLIRTVSFLTLSIMWYFGSMIIAIPLTIWYFYNFRAYELVILGVLIDAYFLSGLSVPNYTLGFLGAFICIELLKPRLRQRDII